MTVRQDDRFITQTFAFVSFDPAPMVRLQGAPGSEKVVVGSYLDFFDDATRGRSDASRQDRVDAEAKWQAMRAAAGSNGAARGHRRDARSGAGGIGRRLRRDLPPGRRDALSRRLAADQRARERTLIWAGPGGLKTWRLADFRADGDESAAAPAPRPVLDDAGRKSTEFGFSDLLVVENFPVALAAYGYTRLGRSPRQALLKAFSPLMTREVPRQDADLRRQPRRPRPSSSSSTRVRVLTGSSPTAGSRTPTSAR